MLTLPTLFNTTTLTRALLASRLPFLSSSLFHTTVPTMGLPAPFAPATPRAADQGPAKIHLYTAPTPNGYKPSIALEELRAAYPDLAKSKLAYDVYWLDFGKKEQKDPEFLKINPNGRIPAIVDENAGGLNVFETASILLWLVEQYDPEHKFSFADAVDHSRMLSWIMFAQGGPGPMMGQLGVFFRNEEKIPFAIKRYADESERLLSVYEDHLSKNSYLVGNKYSIADMNAFTWVAVAGPMLGLQLDRYPSVMKWVDKIAARDAVKEGFKVPKVRVELSEEEKKAKREELAKYVAQA